MSDVLVATLVEIEEHIAIMAYRKQAFHYRIGLLEGLGEIVNAQMERGDGLCECALQRCHVLLEDIDNGRVLIIQHEQVLDLDHAESLSGAARVHECDGLLDFL